MLTFGMCSEQIVFPLNCAWRGSLRKHIHCVRTALGFVSTHAMLATATQNTRIQSSPHHSLKKCIYERWPRVLETIRHVETCVCLALSCVRRVSAHELLRIYIRERASVKFHVCANRVDSQYSISPCRRNTTRARMCKHVVLIQFACVHSFFCPTRFSRTLLFLYFFCSALYWINIAIPLYSQRANLMKFIH